MFLFKKPKIVVDCFINSETTNSLHPIDYAVKFIPEEWKKLPQTVEVKVHKDPRSNLTVTAGTMKKCSGFQYLHQYGFIIPAWSDIAIEAVNGTVYFCDPVQELQVAHHPRNIMWDSLYSGYQHIKITNPWMIKEKTGVKITWNSYPWANTEIADKFHIVSAIIEYQGQHATNINAFVKPNTVIKISAGTPLVHCIPITDKQLDLRTHVLTPPEYLSLHKSYSQRASFVGHHKDMIKLRQAELENSRCPFNKFFGA